MKAYVLDIIREMRHSFGRFFSTMAIVAIGTAFFAGVKASIPDMKYTADQYYKAYNLMDIRLVSTMGFTDEDVEAIRAVDGLEGVMPAYSMDFLTHYDTQQYVVKVIGLSGDDRNDLNYINQMRLVSGRMPKKSDECVIEEQELIKSGFAIGDTIRLESGSEDALSDTLKRDTYRIVGTVYTPDYLSHEKGTSTIGSGKVDLFIGIDADNYCSDYYSEVLVTVKGAKAYNSYTDAYFDVVNQVSAALEQVGQDRSDIRYEQIQTKAQEALAEKEAQYEEARAAFETEISEAQSQLESARDEILLGQAQLESGKINLESTVALSEMQIAQNEATIAQYEIQLEEVVALQKQMHEQYEPIIEQAEARLKEQQAQEARLQAQLADPALSQAEKAALETQLQLVQREIAQLKSTIENSEKAVVTVDEKVATFEQMIADGKRQLEEAKAALAAKKAESEAQFAQAQKQLDAAQEAYVNGKLELEKNRTLGEQELSLAAEKLAQGKEQLSSLPEPTWYVLDRNSHYSYRDYESVTERMDGIAKVFPVFFLLVCALVCLTTMTRMVDEQRSMIGTYKALGYSKVAIAMKYVLYALVAGIVGSVIGCLIGMHLFPSVIFYAWNLMYNLPDLQFEIQIPLALQASLSVIAVTIAATIFACYHELVEVPALLMRPKAPKNGKKIMLERLSFLWSRFSFTQKVTARNLFRYKKRFFMTVIGISGCTALLVAGFGIQDSIAEIVDKQYEEIMQYDSMLTFSADSTYQQRDQVETKLKEDKQIKAYEGIMQKNATVNDDGEETNVTLIIAEDSSDFNEFVLMQNRRSKEELHLNSDGAIITEKLSKNLGVSVGDNVSITLENGQMKEVKITGVMENYVGHTLYMTPGYYKELSGERTVVNAYYIQMKEVSDETEAALGSRYMELDGVSSMSFYSGVAKSFEDTIASISFVVYVLIGAAGLLAFVVLYNLTNVNISERTREIATIKVLGFYPKEVSSYVYRENIVLTLIGGLCGLVLGIALHALIMNLAEMPEVMFGRNIEPLSFVYSMILTLVFAMIVNIVMYRRLRQIPMVESLKSVE